MAVSAHFTSKHTLYFALQSSIVDMVEPVAGRSVVCWHTVIEAVLGDAMGPINNQWNILFNFW